MNNNNFSEDILLNNKTGQWLYHNYAERMPIIDYHCHLKVMDIYEDKEFEDIGQIWLAGDHYKWRAMRTFGIDEKYITGDASWHDKFIAYAKMSPYLVGNPLALWNEFELKRYFDIEYPLTSDNAEEIYQLTKRIIVEKHITPRWCMEKMNVRLVCTTENPTTDISVYFDMKKKDYKTQILTAFRPDQAMFIEKEEFTEFLNKIGNMCGIKVDSFDTMFQALEIRLLEFKKLGTTVSDDGIPYFQWAEYTTEEINDIYQRASSGEKLTEKEINQYRTAFLYEIGKLYHKHGFVMQLHVGTYLDANTREVKKIGQSTGFDCTDDRTSVFDIGKLLDVLNIQNHLPKTIIYPLDSSQIETYAILAAGFCNSDFKGKVQLGAPWWFNDQVYGIKRQFEAVGNLYPVSILVGMLTDSRSFFAYPRHEVYRRVLCDYLGEMIEKGGYMVDEVTAGKIVEDICFNNVNEYFDFHVEGQLKK